MDQLKKYFPLFAIALLAFWQIAFFQHLLKWDNVDYFLPMRHFFSNELRQGVLPGWNPFVNLGFPHFADPQSGSWYPIVWALSLFKSYGFSSLNAEWFLHVFLGGIGMYKLLESLKLQRAAVAMGSIAFMLCGFNVGTAQILPFIIGACWLPWCIWGFKRFVDRPEIKTSVILSFLLYLQITGSYPAFTIVLAYTLLIWWFVALVKAKEERKPMLLQSLVLGILTLSLSSGFLYSIGANLSNLGRSSELVFDQTFVKNSFTFESWLSFIWPYATTAEIPWFNSDTSMINGFVGLLTLVLFLMSPFVLRSRWKWWAILGVAFFLCSAMANVFPLRFWLYEFLPGFAHFKHPSLLRLYGMFLMIVLAASTFDALSRSVKFRRIEVLLLSTFAMLGLGAVIQDLGGASKVLMALEQLANAAEVSQLSITEHIAVQGLFTLFFSLLLLLLHLRFKVKNVLVIFLMLEMVTAAQLNSNITIFNKNQLQKNQSLLESIAKGEYEKPTQIQDAAQVHVGLDDVWQNKSVFKKSWAFNGYNPYMQTSFLEFRETNDFQRMMSLPLVWEKNELFDDLPKKGEIDIEEWGTQHILGKVTVESAPFELVFSQNLHEDWCFFLNGEKMRAHSEFDALMGIDIEFPGVYELDIRYTNRQYKKGLWMTLAGWLVLLGTVVYSRIRN